MKDYKAIINYILDTNDATATDVFKKFKYLFTGENITEEKFYGIQIKDDSCKITYLDNSNNEVRRYETNISKQLKINN